MLPQPIDSPERMGQTTGPGVGGNCLTASLVLVPAPELGVITPDPPLPPLSFPTTEVVLATGVRVGLGLG